MKANAVQHADVLRAVAENPGTLTTPGEVARASGRPTKNISRDVGLLERDGLLIREEGSPFELTPEARLALQGLDVASGRVVVPFGSILVSYGQLTPNPLNPRQRFDPEEIAGLADSIEEEAQQTPGSCGLLQPLVVFPADANGVRMIFAGEKRWRAFGLLISEGRCDPGIHLPCMERAVDSSQVAAQSAFVAIVENGQRGGLTELEEARAYHALMEATGWSARECAKRTKRATGEGFESAARLIQERIRVVREATPENIAAHQRGDQGCTWEWLRDSVKVAKPKATLDLTPKLALALVELADKADKGKDTHPHIADVLEPGYTRLTERPAGGALATLAERGIISLRLIGDARDCYARVLMQSTPAGKWLDENRFNEDRGGLLAHLRTEVLGELTSYGLEQEGRYATAELNTLPLAPFADAEPAGEGVPDPAHQQMTDAPPEPSPTPEADEEEAPLSTRERLAMVELAHKIQTAGVDLDGQVGAAVHEYWVQPTAVAVAQDRRLVMWLHRKDGPPLAVFTDKGRAWLTSQLLLLGERIHVTEPDLDKARQAVAQAGWAGPGFVTPWLNVPPAREPAEAQADAGGSDEPDTEEASARRALLQTAKDALAAVANCYEVNSLPAFETAVGVKLFASLVDEAGHPLPWRPGPDGAVLDANNVEVVTIDVNRAHTDEAVGVIAAALTLAVNVCGGHRPSATVAG